MIQSKIYQAGLDVGSTTAKCVLIDEQGNIVFSEYVRHNTRIVETVVEIITKIMLRLGKEINLSIKVTGSAGMGISERTGVSFVQEVIAASEVVKTKYPEVRTLVDMGGEDSKMIFFFPNRPPDIRMNGSCAGGTGAFIDQMASLLNIPADEFGKLAENYTQIYPIASRCGVFAKTDVQNLISRNVPKGDIAASVFYAVAVQTVNTLARGFDIEPKVMLVGGPFSFQPALFDTFLRVLKLNEEDVVRTEYATLLSAWGAAIENTDRTKISAQELIDKLQSSTVDIASSHRLQPFFDKNLTYDVWQSERKYIRIPKGKFNPDQKETCFLGVDSGSTTTKIVLTNEKDEILFSHYDSNKGNPIKAVVDGITLMEQEIKAAGTDITIARTAVTGYGEELLKAAFSFDDGLVETMAHFSAAKHIQPEVSFIMDIGGQDMKAIFVSNGVVNHIELNEACSSGCGSFIETFGKSLGYTTSDFASEACCSSSPCDLGTRCTVFMNSKVKQSLRENATTADISAGVAYSVIKNALFKVLKLNNIEKLGKHIVVQGGTFKNPAVFRALEILSEAEITSSDVPELMGALGAALVAKENYRQEPAQSSFVGFENLSQVESYKTRQSLCKGCDNNCSITVYQFGNNKRYFSGNKCERFISNTDLNISAECFNMFDYKSGLLFDRESLPKEPGRLTLGVPRVLSLYESYPFWHTLFTNCGIHVELSPTSTMAVYEKGAGTIMSDSICFPAKLVHGHIYELIENQVDRIFMPLVMYEKTEFSNAINSYNCPIVSSYSDVIKSAINPEKKFGIPLDSPVINFSDEKLLKKACKAYCESLNIDKKLFNDAFRKALAAQQEMKTMLQEKAKEVLDHAEANGRPVFVVAGRPYHTDSLINQKLPETLIALGCDILTEDSLPSRDISFADLLTCSQWSYPNRLLSAAKFVASQPKYLQMIQINSFGCGPDAITADECKDILEAEGKSHTLIRVDEITAIGSVRLRLRSLVESLKMTKDREAIKTPRKYIVPFQKEDKRRTILAPHFADMYSPFIPTLFEISGYKLINLPRPDKKSVELGLKYCNNEICYPATIVVGDIVKALQSGEYDRNEIAMGITQTGGQCRASSYLALIKKAMINAGYDDVPIVSLNSGNINNNDQPGFKMDWLKVLPAAFITILFADSISKMYYSLAVREKNKGEAAYLRDYYITKAQPIVKKGSFKDMYALLDLAVDDFNAVEINDGFYPQIGIVGEIYVKYNSFGHLNTVDWLIKQGIEPIVPPIIDFFVSSFVNTDTDIKNNLSRRKLSDIFVKFMEQLSNKYINKTNQRLSRFTYHKPFHNIRDMAAKAERIVSLANQFGEGWQIPAEISSFAEEGVTNVVSLQPFGCIANHVISKGVEKRMKDLYPDLNLLFLDFDDGAGEVNILNRLHFMASSLLKESQVET